MSESTSNFTKKEKDTKIKTEVKRLTTLYAELGENKLKLYRDLISNCAFISVSLEDLKMTLNEKGFTQKYQNGENQFGIKKSSESDVYNAMIKQYASIVKQLDDALPEVVIEHDDGFDSFVGGRDD